VTKRDEPVIVTTTQLAGMLSLSDRRVQQLREEGMPRITRGKWDLMAVIPWYMEQVEKHANPRNKSAEEAQLRYFNARAGLTEHKEAESKGQAISIDEEVAIGAEFTTSLTGAIDSFPLREYDDPKERAIATRICIHVREHLARAIDHPWVGGRKKANGRIAGTPTDTEREPVGGSTPDAATA